MLYVESPYTDPTLNLAIEEQLFFGKTEEIFMLWQNSPSIIIGKNQNAMAEIDYDYVTAQNLPVVRRLSGGGAVYHDLGNLNFTYIVNREGFGDYEGFTKLLCDFLGTLGLNATLSGRNDVLVDGRKVSGNAQYANKGRLLHHGTILVDADMSHLAKALRPDTEKILSKGIKSVQNRVVNLGTLLSMDTRTFWERFSAFAIKAEQMQLYTLTDLDMEAAEKLQKEKYSTYAWNYGFSPKYAFHKKQRFPGGTVEVYLDIREGKIRDAKIYGDFLANATPLSEKFCGIDHSWEALRAVLCGETLGQIGGDELVSCFL